MKYDIDRLTADRVFRGPLTDGDTKRPLPGERIFTDGRRKDRRGDGEKEAQENGPE